MKIAYVTTYNALDVHSWSGLGYNLAMAFKAQNVDLDYIGDLTLKNDRLHKLKRMLYRKMGQGYLMERSFSVAKDYANQVARRLSPSADCILSPGSIPIAYLDSPKPKVFYTDATFAGMIGFYDSFSKLSAETIRQAHKLEQAALSSSSLALYSSDWAAKTAIDNYDVDPKKVKVVPFGANIECTRTTNDIKRLIGSRSKTHCKLLWLGVDWKRKGGQLAVEVMQALNASGLPTELHIAGINSIPMDHVPKGIVHHGFISKSTPEGIAKIEKLIAESHFLILPTRAEAYGLVFCEANSFGVPSIATNVGGIPTIIKDNINGRLFPLSAPAVEHAEYIMNIFMNYPRYEALALSSFNEFQNRLNWKVAGKTIVNLLKDL